MRNLGQVLLAAIPDIPGNVFRARLQAQRVDLENVVRFRQSMRFAHGHAVARVGLHLRLRDPNLSNGLRRFVDFILDGVAPGVFERDVRSAVERPCLSPVVVEHEQGACVGPTRVVLVPRPAKVVADRSQQLVAEVAFPALVIAEDPLDVAGLPVDF